MSIHSYEPQSGHGLAHDPLYAIIAPRPIGWISTRSPSGVLNLAPYSFFNLFNHFPPILGFSSAGWKDTVANIEATGEFVWNLCDEPLVSAMNQSAAPFPPEVDEFERAGLTPGPSQIITVPRVLEAKVVMECKLVQILQLSDHQGAPLKTWLTLGEVVAVHIDKDLIVDGVFDTVKAQPMMRGGGSDYFRIEAGNRFQLTRPSRSE